ncbi:MAG: acyl-CoA dehydratase activase [Acetivibrio ethanolgignens]
MKYIGIDIGSTCTKTVVLEDTNEILLQFVQPTGWSSVDTAKAIEKALWEHQIDVSKEYCVATGYGRVAVPFANKAVTEITCHGKGALWLQKSSSLNIIDIGGQDTKVICMESGSVRDFIMNDKCSAGTGRFLEVMANILAVTPDELCRMAAFGGDISISSMCTVFAESEVISLIGQGETKETIAHAVVESIVQKVASQTSRLDLSSAPIFLTGGLCDVSYIVDALSHVLHTKVVSSQNGRYAGAIGAALCAADLKKKEGNL